MTHLTCLEHGKRVIYKETALIHRNGDGSKCTTMDSSLDLLFLTNATHINTKRMTTGAKLLSVSFVKLEDVLKTPYGIFNQFLKFDEEHPKPYLLPEDEFMIETTQE